MIASVGLWLQPFLVNRSCCPNARRLHVRDYLVVHANTDLKAGVEVACGVGSKVMKGKCRQESTKVFIAIECGVTRKGEEGPSEKVGFGCGVMYSLRDICEELHRVRYKMRLKGYSNTT
ncbi:hypothetical protein Fmac_001817 [Flemingia macrophylla]|uniref:Uncharacterized protein n=1 Tax=Flemingia macrophylla TaxID=520843 RepID=A0ABD1NI61_9FABA